MRKTIKVLSLPFAAMLVMAGCGEDNDEVKNPPVEENENQAETNYDMIDVTTEVQAFITETGIQEGIALVYCSHTTAGITINENADPDVKKDMLRRLDENVFR